MPAKTIYVAESDLPIFEKAQEVAGSSLSAIIVEALREYVRRREREAEGFQEITLKVGPTGAWHQVRFTGRLLARWRELIRQEGRVRRYQVFQTAKGRFALYVRETPDWAQWARQWARAGWEADSWSDHATWPDYETERHFEVYDSLEALKEHVPRELGLVVECALQGNLVEELDI